MIDKTKFALNIIKYRWAIIILVPLLIVTLFVTNIKHAGFETDFDIWFDKDSKIMKSFNHFKKTFGNDSRAMIVLKSEEGVFQKEVLQNIQNITEALWQTKFIARVDSITNYQYVHVSSEDEDEIIVEDFIGDIDALSDEEIRQKEQFAINDIQTKNLLVSADGKTAIVLGRIVYSENFKPEDFITLYHDVNKIIDKYKLDGVEYHNSGVPAGTHAFMDAISSNGQVFLPIFLLSIIVLLGVIFRNIWSIVLPVSVVILTILFIAGFTFGIGYKLNTITSMFPIFIIAIGIADSIHIFWVWKHKREEGLDNEQSVIFTIEKNFTPAFITSLTTFAGFISLGISKIVPLQAFGIMLAGGAVMAFILSIVFLPAMLSVLNPKIKVQQDKTTKLKELIKNYTAFVVRHDKKIIIVSMLFIISFVVGIKDVKVDTEFAKQFSEEHPIRKTTDFVQKNIGGTIAIEVVLDSKEKSGVNNPEFLRDVDKFSNAFEQEFERIRHISSLTQIVKRYHKLMNGDKEEFYKIPDSKELISQYMLLYSLSLPQGMGINDMMDVDSRYLRLTTMINVASEQEKFEMYRWVQNWWETNSQYSASLEGVVMVSGHMRLELTDTLIKSISLALAFVTLIFWFTFRSKFYMAVSTLPNIAPLLIAIGLTGWMSINLDLSMAIVFVIIIGIAIDDTVHFLSKYKAATLKGKGIVDSIEEALLLSGNAVVITTIVLVLGFGTFLLSDFALYSHFGFLSSIALFLAMVFDLLLLPAIISYIDKNKKIKNK